MLLCFKQNVIDIKANTVIILAGINDIAENTGPISLKKNLGNIISMCELANFLMRKYKWRALKSY